MCSPEARVALEGGWRTCPLVASPRTRSYQRGRGVEPQPRYLPVHPPAAGKFYYHRRTATQQIIFALKDFLTLLKTLRFCNSVLWTTVFPTKNSHLLIGFPNTWLATFVWSYSCFLFRWRGGRGGWGRGRGGGGRINRCLNTNHIYKRLNTVRTSHSAAEPLVSNFGSQSWF